MTVAEEVRSDRLGSLINVHICLLGSLRGCDHQVPGLRG
jgi:hypothetical protein